MNISIEYITEQLNNKGIRPSYQRIKVLEYMYQKGGHPTADEIFQTLSANIPSLSKVTIYNTLHAFEKAGMLRAVTIDDTEKRYDLTLTSHGHFLCDACGEIYNFEVKMDQVPVEGLDHFEIKQKDVYFKGLCPTCRKQTTNNK